MHGGRLGRGEEGAAEEVRGGVWASSEGPALRRAGRATVMGRGAEAPLCPEGCARQLQGPRGIPFWCPQHEGWLPTVRRTPIFAPRPLPTVWLTRCENPPTEQHFQKRPRGVQPGGSSDWGMTPQLWPWGWGALTTALGEPPRREPGG